jgi:hypothetical protein
MSTTNKTLATLHGWQAFMRAAGYGWCDTMRTFAAAMCASENENRKSAKREIALSLDYVAMDCRRTCQQFGVPLWPAIIKEGGAK